MHHAAIEALHQIGRRRIINLPEARHYTRHAREHKPARQPDQTLASDFFAESGLAGAQDDQIGIEPQVVNFMQTQESILWLPGFIHEREYQP